MYSNTISRTHHQKKERLVARLSDEQEILVMAVLSSGHKSNYDSFHWAVPQKAGADIGEKMTGENCCKPCRKINDSKNPFSYVLTLGKLL